MAQWPTEPRSGMIELAVAEWSGEVFIYRSSTLPGLTATWTVSSLPVARMDRLRGVHGLPGQKPTYPGPPRVGSRPRKKFCEGLHGGQGHGLHLPSSGIKIGEIRYRSGWTGIDWIARRGWEVTGRYGVTDRCARVHLELQAEHA